MDGRVARLLDIWKRRNIQGLACEDREAAVKSSLRLIPAEATVGLSGSQ